MLEDMSRAAVKVPESELRSLLGCFLFSGDDVFKPLGVLSGGERNRYALARILVSPSNFLLLDEPTNHLDMRAKDVLLEAIAAFSGTVIFVSHDRYFIDRLASRVLEVENGAVITYEGNYEDYLRKKEQLVAGGPASQVSESRPFDRLRAGSGAPTSITACHPERSEGPAVRDEPSPPSPNGSAPNGTSQEKSRRLNPIKQKQMEQRCAFLEEEVPRIESAIAHTEQQLGVYVSAEETQRLTNLAQELRAQLAALTAEWEELMMQLEGA
jgi:ATP-binding cassette subfamily F protein 3